MKAATEDLAANINSLVGLNSAILTTKNNISMNVTRKAILPACIERKCRAQALIISHGRSS
jgi:hypothetical protein